MAERRGGVVSFFSPPSARFCFLRRTQKKQRVPRSAGALPTKASFLGGVVSDVFRSFRRDGGVPVSRNLHREKPEWYCRRRSTVTLKALETQILRPHFQKSVLGLFLFLRHSVQKQGESQAERKESCCPLGRGGFPLNICTTVQRHRPITMSNSQKQQRRRHRTPQRPQTGRATLEASLSRGASSRERGRESKQQSANGRCVRSVQSHSSWSLPSKNLQKNDHNLVLIWF